MAVNGGSKRLFFKRCGDGLWYLGGDLICFYRLLSSTVNSDNVVFEYAPYTITVTWEVQGNKRVNPTWKRTYKKE